MACFQLGAVALMHSPNATNACDRWLSTSTVEAVRTAAALAAARAPKSGAFAELWLLAPGGSGYL